MRTSYLLITVVLSTTSSAMAQSVCLPAPRLLTTMPMGGQVGTTVEVAITGDNIESVDELSFSHPGITATPKLDENGLPVTSRFVVTIAADCPTGIHEARVMTRLGVSSSRVFNVGDVSEVTRSAANNSLETAMPLQVNSICNANMTAQAINYFTFEAEKDQRIVVDCAARGIDSKLRSVLIIADANGADLVVERRGGALDFTVPESGTYVIKVHDLTYSGGPHHFYRLAVSEVPAGQPVPRLPSVKWVHSFSWPPAGLNDEAAGAESELNDGGTESQKVTLPCDISGSFFPAADVDTFEFTAKKGEVWWVEVASHRLGLPTDPSVVVQHISGAGDEVKVTDVAELSDIPSPMKTSSNGYSYDGPPYNAGSSDVNGRFEVKADGVHRLQIRDLFGGTRNDPRNAYRLIVRKATPDFSLVGWALHMGLRNGDRAAFSKPIALRGGSTMPIEVVVIRRDGFTGEIELSMENLPEGVTAAGVKIPAGQNRGILLISAASAAPRGLTSARIIGRATINDETVTRPCPLASMQWPVPDASREIPSPRLLADVPVSVSGQEQAPLTIVAAQDVIEVTEGEKLTLPFVHTQRSDFSGSAISMKSWCSGMGNVPGFDAPLNAESSETIIDLAALKAKPGDYVLAFYGGAVAKYRYNPEAVAAAQAALDQAKEQGLPEADIKAAEQRLKDVTARAQPKDIVDIIVTKPVTIRVKPADKPETAEKADEK